jgi:hypothetical protein
MTNVVSVKPGPSHPHTDIGVTPADAGIQKGLELAWVRAFARLSPE